MDDRERGRAERRAANIVEETETLRERGAKSETRATSAEMELKRVKLELAEAHEKIAEQERMLNPPLDEMLESAEHVAALREAELQRSLAMLAWAPPVCVYFLSTHVCIYFLSTHVCVYLSTHVCVYLSTHVCVFASTRGLPRVKNTCLVPHRWGTAA